MADDGYKSNPAGCHRYHARTGTVVNVSQVAAFQRDKPCMMKSTCDRPECIDKAIRWAAAGANETAIYISDAERRTASGGAV